MAIRGIQTPMCHCTRYPLPHPRHTRSRPALAEVDVLYTFFRQGLPLADIEKIKIGDKVSGDELYDDFNMNGPYPDAMYVVGMEFSVGSSTRIDVFYYPNPPGKT